MVSGTLWFDRHWELLMVSLVKFFGFKERLDYSREYMVVKGFSRGRAFDVAS